MASIMVAQNNVAWRSRTNAYRGIAVPMATIASTFQRSSRYSFQHKARKVDDMAWLQQLGSNGNGQPSLARRPCGRLDFSGYIRCKNIVEIKIDDTEASAANRQTLDGSRSVFDDYRDFTALPPHVERF